MIERARGKITEVIRNRITPEKIFSVEQFVLGKIPVNYEATGVDNLDKMRELHESGKQIIVISDHRSLADIASGSSIAIKEGLADLIEETHFIISQKYIDNPLTRPLLRGIHVVPMISPTQGDDPRKSEINGKAVRTVLNLGAGSISIILPEATRVKTGKMIQAQKEVSTLLRLNKRSVEDDIYIFPMCTERTEEQWPPGWTGVIKYFGGGFRKKMKVIFGKPFPLAEINELSDQITDTLDIDDEKQLKLDLAMMRVAILHIIHGNSKYVDGGYYGDLSQDIWEKWKNLLELEK